MATGKNNSTIWKFPFLIAERFVLSLPTGARILTAQAQRDNACLWAEVDPQAPVEQRVFHIVGTGHTLPVETALNYIATFQMLDGALVWHLYEDVSGRRVETFIR